MKDKAIENLIRSKMGGWDGMHAQSGPFQRRNKNDLKGIDADWNEWARAVRRDILVLEHHLLQRFDLTPDDLYGDPGDPPPPPD